MKDVATHYIFALCIILPASIAVMYSGEEPADECSLETSVETIQKNIDDLLGNIQDAFSTLDSELEELQGATTGSIDEANNQVLDTIEKIDLEIELINEQLEALDSQDIDQSQPLPLTTPQDRQLLAIQLANPFVSITREGDCLLAAASKANLKPTFKLCEGDHDLWHGDCNDLWGYDACGNLFHIDRNLCRSSIGNSTCLNRANTSCCSCGT
jgi:hypothetical protein